VRGEVLEVAARGRPDGILSGPQLVLFGGL
jgi:hypothetical protein